MRVLYVLRKFPNISNTFIISEIIELIRQGHDVDIISLSQAGDMDIKSHPSISEYNLIQRTRYITKLCVFRDMGKNIHRYIGDDIYTKFWGKGQIRTRLICNYIYSIIKNGNYHVVHTHFAKENAKLALAAAFKAGVPFTFTTHAFDLYDRDKRAKPWDLKIMIKYSKKAITISEYNRNNLIKICGNQYRNRIAVVHCGIDLERFRYEYHPNAMDVLTVARLVEKKGIDMLIRAMARVVEQRDMRAVRLHIVGDGPLKEYLLSITYKHKLENNIIFHGWIDDETLLKLYAVVGVFVLPCRIAENGDRDGIPVSLMEAMALGVPVISTNVSGIPELIENGVNGILVQPDDTESLADAITTLLQDRKLSFKLTKEGRKKVENDFNISKSVKHLVDIWSQGEYNAL